MNSNRLLVCIVNRGQAEGMLTELRAFGVRGGLVLAGEGTQRNKILTILGLDQTRKEIMFLPIPASFETSVHSMLEGRFKLKKKNRGIAFSMPISRFALDESLKEDDIPDPDQFDYRAIFVIADHGKSRDIMDYCNEIGVNGGTILKGKGAGRPSKDSAFNLEIKPEKDIVMLVTESSKAGVLKSHLEEKLELKKAGTGVLFSLPVSMATGIYRESKEGTNE